MARREPVIMASGERALAIAARTRQTVYLNLAAGNPDALLMAPMQRYAKMSASQIARQIERGNINRLVILRKETEKQAGIRTKLRRRRQRWKKARRSW